MWQGLKVSLLAGRVLPSFALTCKPFPALGEEMFQLARLSKQCLCSPPDGSSKKTKQLLYLLWCIRRGKGNFAKETKHYALKFSPSHPNTPKYVFRKGKANNYRCISLTTSHVSLVVHCYDLFHFLCLICDRVSGLIFLHTDNMIPHVSLYSIFWNHQTCCVLAPIILPPCFLFSPSSCCTLQDGLRWGNPHPSIHTLYDICGWFCRINWWYSSFVWGILFPTLFLRFPTDLSCDLACSNESSLTPTLSATRGRCWNGRRHGMLMYSGWTSRANTRTRWPSSWCAAASSMSAVASRMIRHHRRQGRHGMFIFTLSTHL